MASSCLQRQRRSLAVQRADHFLMKRAYFFLSCFFPVLFACNAPQENAGAKDSALFKALDSIQRVAKDPMDEWMDEDSISCEDLNNKSIVFRIARQHAFLSSYSGTIDTTNTLVLKGHFIDNKTEQTLVWIADYPMPSCGDGCNLVMLFSCEDKAKLLLNINTGVFTKENVRDLNNDGVLEIITESSVCRMGECHSHYEVFNLAGTVQNFLYKAHSYSLVEESWGDNYEGYFDKGETLLVEISPKLVDDGNGIYKIKQVREVKTFNGGKTIAEITGNMIRRIDSSFVPLKKIK
jgi:hypothetical protein